MPSRVILVVGTTPDYVVKLNKIYPEGLLFITDSNFRDSPLLTEIPASALLFRPLGKGEEILEGLAGTLSESMCDPAGVACFDCESLFLASRLAKRLGLPFPSSESVLRARNKIEAGRLWHECGVPSPNALLCSTPEEALEAFDRFNHSVVLKPLSGSGSELVFHCTHKDELDRALQTLQRELPTRRSHALFRPLAVPCSSEVLDPCSTWTVEEYIHGPEFSCDFVLEEGRAKVIRETGKLKAPDQTFGSVLAYLFPPLYPSGFSKEVLIDWIERAAGALGFFWGHFMVDFMISEGLPVFIEMTPRPGGDSIPDLIRTAVGTDLLKFHLDFMSRRTGPYHGPGPVTGAFASVNIFAPKQGILRRLDTSRLSALPWVREVFLKKAVGDRILLPPVCYDDRILGHAVIALDSPDHLPLRASEIQGAVEISIEDYGQL
ncbi:MAG: ATP-grasp domain-containing protein [Desulfatiglandales bacterium]